MAGTTVNLKLLIAATNTASNEVVKLQGQLNQLSRGAEKLGERSAKGAKVGKDGITDYGKGVDSFTDKMGKAKAATEGFGTAGLALVGVAATLAGVTFFPVKSAADFEQALSGVIAVTDNAVEKFNELKNVAGELGRTTKFTATQVAEGMQFLGQAGFTAREVIEGIGPSLQLAIAAAVSLGEASNIATNVLSGMRLPVSELTNVVDILAQTAAKSNAELLDMAEALSYAGPVAQAAGVEIEELAALVGVLGNAGIQGSRAGTALRNVLFGLTKGAGVSKDRLDELGVTITKTADGSIDLVDVFHQLADAQIDVGDAQLIFGRYAAAGVLAITSQIDSLDDMVIANNAAAGAAKKMADIMKDNLKGAITELTSALDGLKRAFGDPLLGPMRNTVETLTFLVSGLTSLADKIPITIGLLGTLTVAVAAAALAVGGLGLAIGGLNTTFTVLGGKGMVNTIKGWKRFGSLTGLLTAGVKKLFAVIKGHPFIALGVAVAGVVLWFTELSERTNRLTLEAQAATTSFDNLRAKFDKQATALKEMRDGSEQAVATAKNLREELLETAKETKGVATEALRAANSINQMTGSISDSGEAIAAFIDKTKDLARLNMIKQVNLVNDQLDRQLHNLMDVVYWWDQYVYAVDRLIALIPFGKSWGDVVDEYAEKTKRLRAQLEATNRTYIEMLQRWGEFDPSMSTQEAIEYFRLLEGLSKERAKSLADINDKMQDEARRTRDVKEELESMTLEEVKASVKATTKEVNLMRDAYENLREKSEAASKKLESLSESERKHAKSLKEEVKSLLEERATAAKTLTDREVEQNQTLVVLKRDLNKKIQDEYDEDLKAHKKSKELGYIAEWQYANKVADLNKTRAEGQRATLTTLQEALEAINSTSTANLPIAENIAKEIEKADQKVVDSSDAAKDSRIKHANAVQSAVESSIREAESMRIDLMQEGPKKFEDQLAQELDILRQDAKKRGIELDKISGIINATKQKYVRIQQDWEAEQTLKRAGVEHDAEMQILQDKFALNEQGFRDRVISAEQYATTNIQIQEDMLAEELKLLKAQLEEAEKLGDKNPVVIKVKYEIKDVKKRQAELKKAEPDIKGDAKLREQIRANQIDQQITRDELANMDIRYESLEEMSRKRLELLDKQHEGRIMRMRAAGAKDAEIERQQNADSLARTRATEAERRAILEEKLTWGVEIASTAEDAFAGMYEQSGEKAKAWFYLEKAAAIARVGMHTAVAIMRAYSDMGPYAGSIMAGLLILKGAAQIAKIRAATYAEGGEVQGKSPHKKSDNILARVTAKEWVHPVETAQYYGRDVMEGIRKRIFPKEIFEGYRLPTPQAAIASRRSYGSGGEVGSGQAEKEWRGSGRKQATTPPTPINIVNIIDPSEMDHYLSSSSGQNAILNVLSSRGETVKRILK